MKLTKEIEMKEIAEQIVISGRGMLAGTGMIDVDSVKETVVEDEVFSRQTRTSIPIEVFKAEYPKGSQLMDDIKLAYKWILARRDAPVVEPESEQLEEE